MRLDSPYNESHESRSQATNRQPSSWNGLRFDVWTKLPFLVQSPCPSLVVLNVNSWQSLSSCGGSSHLITENPPCEDDDAHVKSVTAQSPHIDIMWKLEEWGSSSNVVLVT
ncbi:hypothetical protein TNCV_196811 [Trichonephila clavipes]|uniref:Uncharacterized protein n=1 Tax=Trichonephila clavipes TaxID=2585209 RepID=A0A8X7BKR7_TRICX|nr:hypothetical protein TNCV_196811 [Trichonephila clavipes]